LNEVCHVLRGPVLRSKTARYQSRSVAQRSTDADEGAIIASQLPDPVSFATLLNDRIGNLVPVDSVEEVLDAVDAYTQTVGVYPESLKEELKDVLPLYGAQRIVSLGYAVALKWAAPQDAIEPLRRMGKWISNQISDPKIAPGPWTRPPVE
jgi:hypothetical protein